MTLNMDYATTRAGKFKMITLSVGFFAMVFTLVAFNNGSYYESKCKEGGRRGPGFNGGHRALSNTYLNESTVMRYIYGLKCQELTPNTEDQCNGMNRAYKAFVKDQRARGVQVTPSELKLCPSSYLVSPPAYIILFTWLISLLTLFVMLCVDLNEKISAFKKLDFIGNLIAGSLLLLMALAMAGFVVWIFLSDYPCVQDEYEDILQFYAPTPPPKREYFQDRPPQETPRSTTTSPPTTKLNLLTKSGKFNRLMLYAQFTNKDGSGGFPAYQGCAGHTNDTYYHWVLMIGIVCTAATGSLYIVTAMMVKKQPQRAPRSEVAPVLSQVQPPLEGVSPSVQTGLRSPPHNDAAPAAP